MATAMGQITLNNSTGVMFGVLAPGSTVTLTSVTATSTCYIGQQGGTLLTANNGVPVVSGGAPYVISLPLTAQAQTLYALGSGNNVMAYQFESTT